MKFISRRATRFRERFIRAIDRGSTEQPPTTIQNNNPNVNIQYGSGIINNHSQNITHIVNTGPLKDEVGPACAT